MKSWLKWGIILGSINFVYVLILELITRLGIGNYQFNAQLLNHNPFYFIPAVITGFLIWGGEAYANNILLILFVSLFPILFSSLLAFILGAVIGWIIGRFKK